MFKKNTKHTQTNLFGIDSVLPAQLCKQMEDSEEHTFYKLIFSNIREEDFACLFSEVYSRPNAPVNCLVASILLQHRNRWTIEKLFTNINFNLLTIVALGLRTFDEVPFSEATFFNFQNRLNDYSIKNGVNLLSLVFDALTARQLKDLGIKSDIQRTDSFQAGSNIRKYSRMQMLVEMLIRIHRVLDETHKKQYEALFAPYVRKTSGQFIYRLESTEFDAEFERIGAVYKQIHDELFSHYQSVEVFTVFARMMDEHFVIADSKIALKQPSELTSSSLQSPDDIDATFRKKQNKEYRGTVVNVVETCNPGNPLNLITDIAVSANNVDDSTILNNRIDIVKEKTPDLNELHFDGGYGSVPNDKKFAHHEITPIQTAIRGRDPQQLIQIDRTGDGCYNVSCPGQTTVAEQGRKRFVAEFALAVCASCPLATKCSLIQGKSARRYYFTEDDYYRLQRAQNIKDIPLERRSLRTNVEATVSEFTRKCNNHKLKVRGIFKTEIFAFATGISINFGRIARYMASMEPSYA